jgi:tetratricopeptide (TPR) repeat protein
MDSVRRPDLGDAVTGPLDMAVSLSYRDLSAAHRAVLRCVAALPGANFSLDAAAAALDAERAVVDRQLEVLVDHHLIEDVERHRYRLHDAIRAFALGIVPADPRAAAAVQRAAAYYIATAARAERVSRPHRRAAQRVEPGKFTVPEFADRTAAEDWLTTEYSALRELAEHRATPLPPVAQVCLAGILAKHLDRRGMWHQARELLDRAGLAARDHPDPLPELVEAELATDTAAAHIRTGQFDTALALAERALELFTAHDDARGQADALMEIGRVHRHGAQHRKALTALRASAECFARAEDEHGRISAHLQSAVVLYQSGRRAQGLRLAEQGVAQAAALGEEALLVDALIDLGEMHRLADAAPVALAHFADARALAQRIGDQYNLATLALNIGYVHRDAGRWDEAIDELTLSRGIFGRMRDAYHEAEALIALAELHRRRGQLSAAAESLEEGEALAEHSGRDRMRLDAATARARLLLDQAQPAEAARTARAVLAHPEVPAPTAHEAERILAQALALATQRDEESGGQSDAVMPAEGR